MKIAIIGAGASGLFLGSMLNGKHDVTIYEKQNKPGSKILASGAGHANIGNLNIESLMYNDPVFMDKLLELVSEDDILNTFKEYGMLYKSDSAGRIYPYSESSLTVLNTLLEHNQNNKIIYDTPIEKIKFENGKYKLNDFNIFYDILVIASGSIANFKKEKSNDIYRYIKNFNIPFIDIKPALSGLKTNLKIKTISGVRSKALVKLYHNNDLIDSELGEVIFKDEGISGIAVMNLSNSIKTLDKTYYLTLDLFPEYSENELATYLKKYGLMKALNPKLASYIIKNNLNPKCFSIPITDFYGFEFAQVVSGGIALSFIDEYFESKMYKNLFSIGEVLDINGKCGGFNLFFAFASAYVVGKRINKNEI